MLTHLMNLLLYVFKIVSPWNIIKCYEIFTLLIIYDLRDFGSINNLFAYSHLIMIFLKYKMST